MRVKDLFATVLSLVFIGFVLSEKEEVQTEIEKW